MNITLIVILQMIVEMSNVPTRSGLLFYVIGLTKWDYIPNKRAKYGLWDVIEDLLYT